MNNISELSNIQAESGIIGSLIFHPEYALNVEYLKEQHFYGVENGCIYSAILSLVKEGITNIDAFNLSNKLSGTTALDKFNLPSVQEMIELYKIAARDTVEEYKSLADDVVTFAFRRQLVGELDRLKSKCFQRDVDLDELNNEVLRSVDGITEKFITAGETHTLGDEIDDIWGEIVSRRTENGLYGIPSKYTSFSEYFTYEPGELVVVQAKYKQGKSVFLMNEVVHKLQNGVPTLVIDSEMMTRLYVERLIAHLSGVPIQKIKSGKYGEQEDQRIKSSIEWIKKQPFVHIYDPNLTNEKLYSICKMWKHKIGLQFVCYDYLKSNATDTGDNYNLLGAKSDFLKNNIAGELDLAVLAACQLNRNGEVADSIKINRYLSVGIKWEFKSQDMIACDGQECGNTYAKIYVNRLGKQMLEDNQEDYIDFYFDGDTMTISECQQHERKDTF